MAVYRLNAIPIKIKTLATYFVDIDNLILKLIWRGRRHRVSNTILKEKNRVGEFDTTQLQDLIKLKVIKTVWYWQKKR